MPDGDGPVGHERGGGGMRHVGLAVTGLIGVVVGLVALGIGIHLAFQAMARGDPGGLYAALPVLLIGGVATGGVLVAGRWSRAAPLAGGGLLLVVAVLGTLFPNNMFSIDGIGMGAVTGGPLAVVVLLGAIVVRPSRRAPPVAPHPPGPHPPGPHPSAPHPPGPHPSAPYPPGPYPPGPAPYGPGRPPGSQPVPPPPGVHPPGRRPGPP